MDEVTGLHAFDHLDPVSALNVLPEEPEPAAPPPRAAAPRQDVRPPAPAFRGRSLPPPPPPRGGPAGLSVPPPPPMRSFAPPAVGPGDQAPPRLSQPVPASSRPVPSPSSPSWARARAAVAQRPSQVTDQVTDDALTQRVAFDQLAPRSDYDEYEATSVIAMGQQNGQVDPMTSVATSIDMDWDEDEEPQTNMRDELQPARASATDFDSVVHVPATAPASYMPPANAAARPSLMPQQYGRDEVGGVAQGNGQPSPFVAASSMTAVHSWEDDAETRVQAPIAVDPSLAEPPWARQSATTTDTMLDSPDDEQPSKLRVGLPWLALAGVLAVGLALGVRAMMAPPALATVTLVTQPADAEVSVDGRPLVGQTSPFTIQGLAPESEHSLVVRSEGHAEHTSRFSVEPGETKSLSAVELQPVKVDTGFAINSQPAGAKVFVDGQPLELETPARIANLAPGLHTVRLERGEKFLPWETQVAVAVGQVIELESAQLVPSSAVKSEGGSRGGDEGRAERRARRAERRAEKVAAKEAADAAKRDARASKAAAKANAKAAVASKAKPVPVAKPAPVVAGGGTLRVNSRPWSQVYVDGKLVGNTPQLGISLAPGSHKLKLVSPDLGMTKQLTVRIEKGKATTKVVNLIE